MSSDEEQPASRPEAVRVVVSAEDERVELPAEARVELSAGAGRAALSCGLRRRSAGDRARTPDLPLNLQVGYRVSDGGPERGTPSPCSAKFIPSTRERTSGASTSLEEFRSKQHSFEIHIEDCDEEEIAIESDGEGDTESPRADRPVTPVPVQDYGCVTYTEGPQPSDYLQVRSVYNDCLTDVSDAESDENEEA